MSQPMSQFEIDRIAQAIRTVVGPSETPVPLHEPTLRGNERDYLESCLSSTYVSSVGAFVPRFEEMVAEAMGAAHAVAVVNGTAALHICLKLAGAGPGDDVIVPALTFVATANAVAYCGAQPHFADCEESTLGLDPEALASYLRSIRELRGGACFDGRTGRRLAAIVPVHVLGLPVDLDAFRALSERFAIPLVEDMAQALGSTYRGCGIAASTRLGAVSFNGNKIVTTGGGGAILTNDAELAKRAKHLTTTARLLHRWDYAHDEIGFNYRMPNLNAALGCAQLEALPRLLTLKRELHERYREAFAGMNGVRLLTEPGYGTSNYWLNAILLVDESGASRDALLEATHDAGILTRPAWTLLHELPMYRGCPHGDLSVAQSIARRLVKLPSSAHLGRSS